MEVISLIARIVLGTILLGLVFEFAVPMGDRIVDGAAAFCAIATWIAPLLILLRWQIRKPKASLVIVGYTISMIAYAACFSFAGIALAVITLLFAESTNWAWPGLLAIAAFWPTAMAFVWIGGRLSPPPARPPGRPPVA